MVCGYGAHRYLFWCAKIARFVAIIPHGVHFSAALLVAIFVFVRAVAVYQLSLWWFCIGSFILMLRSFGIGFRHQGRFTRGIPPIV